MVRVDYQGLLHDAMTAGRAVSGRGQGGRLHPGARGRGSAPRSAWPWSPSDGGCTASATGGPPFSVQSISKVFTLALALAHDGDALWRRVGREPSGNPFNSLVQLEYEHGIPRNPFINAGALVVTDRLLTLTGDAAGVPSWTSCAPSAATRPGHRPGVAASEAEHGHRNAALAHFMAPATATSRTRSTARAGPLLRALLASR